MFGHGLVTILVTNPVHRGHDFDVVAKWVGACRIGPARL